MSKATGRAIEPLIEFKCSECDGSGHHTEQCPKRRVLKVIVERAEGWAHECVKVELKGIVEADAHLFVSSRTAPEDGSYHKCDVLVEFTDGIMHGIRFDLERSFKPGDLVEALKREAAFYSGRWRPDHLSPAQHLMLIERVPALRRAQLSDIHARYER